MIIIQNKNLSYIIIAFLTIIYIIFPTSNSGIDAYNYAANVKWNHDLFFPHHLIYNLPAWLIVQLFQKLGYSPDVLSLMKLSNAIVAGSTLLVFNLILRKLKLKNQLIYGSIIIVGSSFGFFRFATENEAYIFPLFFSILASLQYFNFLNSRKSSNLFLIGFFAIIACLFHQIHIFWFIGLFIGVLIQKVNLKQLVVFLLPSLLFPLIYFIAYKYGNNTFMQADSLLSFTLFDYYYGTAQFSIDTNQFVLGILNFFRTFLQVHGIMLIFLKKAFYIIIVALVALYFFIKALLKLNFQGNKKENNSTFYKTHLIIFIFQFSFALIAWGNAEFMVMLPFLLLIIVHAYIILNAKFYINIGIAVFIWNLFYAIIPGYVCNYNNDTKLINMIGSNKEFFYILSEDVLIQNILYYDRGEPWNHNLLKSPAGYKLNGLNNSILTRKIDSLLNNEQSIYTDCIDAPKIYNRAAFLSKNVNEFFFKEYLLNKTDSFETFAGFRYLYKLTYFPYSDTQKSELSP